jgi:hypothetical protein
MTTQLLPIRSVSESWISSLFFTFSHRRLEENPAIETCQARRLPGAIASAGIQKTALLHPT